MGAKKIELNVNKGKESYLKLNKNRASIEKCHTLRQGNKIRIRKEE